LHIVLGRLRDEPKASGWNIDHFLCSLYWLFHDNPAKREDFSKVKG